MNGDDWQSGDQKTRFRQLEGTHRLGILSYRHDDPCTAAGPTLPIRAYLLHWHHNRTDHGGWFAVASDEADLPLHESDQPELARSLRQSSRMWTGERRAAIDLAVGGRCLQSISISAYHLCTLPAPECVLHQRRSIGATDQSAQLINSPLLLSSKHGTDPEPVELKGSIKSREYDVPLHLPSQPLYCITIVPCFFRSTSCRGSLLARRLRHPTWLVSERSGRTRAETLVPIRLSSPSA